ncbi:MAG: BCCT family transporter [Clostridia bacterium]|nr:BCCT family transporter [Clostridia bacterium]
MENGKIAKINKTVFWGSTLVCLLFFGPMIIFQESAQGLVGKVMYAITHGTDWLWESIVFGAVLFSLWLAFGPYGNVKLGGPDEKPEFSTFTWFAMMFCGGSGAGLIYWGILEPIYYLKWPPFWAEPHSAQAAQWALSYGIFHWGISAWGTFVIPAIGFAYMFYVRKKPYLYPSYACRGVFGDKVDGSFGRIIDLIMVVGMVGGVATSLGLILPMITNIAADYLGLQDTLWLRIVVAALYSCLYGYSCYKGLYSGIARISNINMYMRFLLILFVLFAGPTLFMLSLFFDNIGMLLQNFLRMSLYTDPITKSGFPQDWTVFYWAWWFAWATYMGLFATRISRGRTIKQLVLNMLFTATAGCATFYLTFGSYTVDMILNKGVDLITILQESGGPAVITYLLNTLPFASVAIPLFLIVMLVSQVTAVDSVSYTISAMCCHEIRDTQEPPKWSRIFWSFMLFFCTCSLFVVGGLQVVQLSSIILAFPVAFVTVILAVSLVKWLREDFGEIVKPRYLTYADSKLASEVSETTDTVNRTITPEAVIAADTGK